MSREVTNVKKSIKLSFSEEEDQNDYDYDNFAKNNNNTF